jgi:hypothetical protein
VPNKAYIRRQTSNTCIPEGEHRASDLATRGLRSGKSDQIGSAEKFGEFFFRREVWGFGITLRGEVLILWYVRVGKASGSFTGRNKGRAGRTGEAGLLTYESGFFCVGMLRSTDDKTF